MGLPVISSEAKLLPSVLLRHGLRCHLNTRQLHTIIRACPCVFAGEDAKVIEISHNFAYTAVS